MSFLTYKFNQNKNNQMLPNFNTYFVINNIAISRISFSFSEPHELSSLVEITGARRMMGKNVDYKILEFHYGALEI